MSKILRKSSFGKIQRLKYYLGHGPLRFWVTPCVWRCCCLNFGAFGFGLPLRFTRFWHEITRRLLAEVQHFACRSSPSPSIWLCCGTCGTSLEILLGCQVTCKLMRLEGHACSSPQASIFVGVGLRGRLLKSHEVSHECGGTLFLSLARSMQAEPSSEPRAGDTPRYWHAQKAGSLREAVAV